MSLPLPSNSQAPGIPYVQGGEDLPLGVQGVPKVDPGPLYQYGHKLQQQIETRKEYQAFRTYSQPQVPGQKAAPNPFGAKAAVLDREMASEYEKVLPFIQDKIVSPLTTGEAVDKLMVKDVSGARQPRSQAIKEEVRKMVYQYGGNDAVVETVSALVQSRLMATDIKDPYEENMREFMSAAKSSGLLKTNADNPKFQENITKFKGIATNAAKTLKKRAEGWINEDVAKVKQATEMMAAEVNARYEPFAREISQNLANDEIVNYQFRIDQYAAEQQALVDAGQLLPAMAQNNIARMAQGEHDALVKVINSKDFQDKVTAEFDGKYGEQLAAELEPARRAYAQGVDAAVKKANARVRRQYAEVLDIMKPLADELNTMAGDLDDESKRLISEVANLEWANVQREYQQQQDDFATKRYWDAMPKGLRIDAVALDALSRSMKFNWGLLLGAAVDKLQSIGFDSSVMRGVAGYASDLSAENVQPMPSKLEPWMFLSPAFIGQQMGQLVYAVPGATAAIAAAPFTVGVSIPAFVGGFFGAITNATVNAKDVKDRILQQRPWDLAGANEAAKTMFWGNMATIPLEMVNARFWTALTFARKGGYRAALGSAASEFFTEDYEAGLANTLVDGGNLFSNMMRKDAVLEGWLAGYTGILTGGFGATMARVRNNLSTVVNTDAQYIAGRVYDQGKNRANAEFIGIEDERGEDYANDMAAKVERVAASVEEAKQIGMGRPQALMYAQLSEELYAAKAKADAVANPIVKKVYEAKVSSIEQKITKLIDAPKSVVPVKVGSTEFAVDEADAPKLIQAPAMQDGVAAGLVSSPLIQAPAVKVEPVETVETPLVIALVDNAAGIDTDVQPAAEVKTLIDNGAAQEDIVPAALNAVNAMGFDAAEAAFGPEIVRAVRSYTAAKLRESMVRQQVDPAAESAAATPVIEQAPVVEQVQPGVQDNVQPSVQAEPVVQTEPVEEIAQSDMPQTESDVQDRAARRQYLGRVEQDTQTYRSLTPDGKIKKLDGMYTRLVQAKNQGIITREEFDDQYDAIAGMRQALMDSNPKLKATAKEAQASGRGARPQMRASEPGSVAAMPADQRVDNLRRSLESAGIRVDVYDNSEEFDNEIESVSGQRQSADGVFDAGNGRILLDASKISDPDFGGRIIWHEGSHPVLNIIRNTNRPLYDQALRGITALAEAGNAAAQEAIDWASKNYEGADVVSDEALTEAVAMVADGTLDLEKIPVGMRQAIIDFVNAIAKALGLGAVLPDSSGAVDMRAFKDLATQVSSALKSGEDIANVVGADNVTRFENTVAQDRAVSVAKGTESMKKYGIAEGRNNVRKIGEALESRTRKKFGTIGRDDRSKTALSKISGWMAEEFKYFYELYGDRSGMRWYGEKFQRGLDKLADIFPEMATDQNARDLFTMLVAVMSDGANVLHNFKLAASAYPAMKARDISKLMLGGNRQSSYYRNAQRILDLINEYDGDIQAIKTKLLERVSISELNKERKKMGLEKLETSWPASFVVPYASSIFGPKLGMFYANLSGMEDYPTLDRWWSRTFNRYRGTLIPKVNRGVDSKGKKIGIDAYREVVGLEGATEDEVIVSIVRDQKSYADKGFKNGTEAETKANTIYKALFIELNDAPFGAGDRQFMYDAFVETKKRLKRAGIDATIADIQAVLWYFEKNLYKTLGASAKVEGISYEEAAAETVRKYNEAGQSFEYKVEKLEDEEEGVEAIDEDAKDPGVQASKGERNKNVSARTQGFFSDVVTGKSDKYKPIREWVPVLSFDQAQSAFKSVYDKFMGNFDLHIATSIPTFRETQIKVGNAIVSMLPQGGLVYDIAGSEGGFVKAITESSGGKIKSINLDPNPDMVAIHNATPVEGSQIVAEAFLEGFDNYVAHRPDQRADVVHESMGFQFIGPDRKPFVDEVASRYLKEDGLFITEEKFRNENKDDYRANERKKQAYKDLYYTREQQAMKSDDVLVGMEENQAYADQYVADLKSRFAHVEQYWDSGNFKGYVASNSRQRVDEFLSRVGSTESEFTNSELLNNGGSEFPVFREYKFNPATALSFVKRMANAPVDKEDGVTLNLDGSVYTGDGLIVPVVSRNTNISGANANALSKFVADNAEKIGSDAVKVGLYKFPGGKQMSMDLNIVVPESAQDVAVDVARSLGQESVYNMRTGEYIKTGETGQSPVRMTDREAREAAVKLPQGQRPGVQASVGNRADVRRAKSVAQRIRGAKVKTDRLYDAILGLPIAVYNGMLETVATMIEAGSTIADAITSGVEYIKANVQGEKFTDKEVRDAVVADMERLGIKPEPVKPGQTRADIKEEFGGFKGEGSKRSSTPGGRMTFRELFRRRFAAEKRTASAVRELQTEAIKYFRENGIDLTKGRVARVLKSLAALADVAAVDEVAAGATDMIADLAEQVDAIVAEQEFSNEIAEANEVMKKFSKFVRKSKTIDEKYRAKLASIVMMAPSKIVMALRSALENGNLPALFSEPAVLKQEDPGLKGTLRQFIDALNLIMKEYGGSQGVRELTMGNLDYMVSEMNRLAGIIAEYEDRRDREKYEAAKANGETDAPTYDDYVVQREEMRNAEAVMDAMASTAKKKTAVDKMAELIRVQQERIQDWLVEFDNMYADDKNNPAYTMIRAIAEELRDLATDRMSVEAMKEFNILLNNLLLDGNVMNATRFLSYWKDYRQKMSDVKKNPMRIRAAKLGSMYGLSNLMAALTFNTTDAAKLRQWLTPFSASANKVWRMLHGYEDASKSIIADIQRLVNRFGEGAHVMGVNKVGAAQFLAQADDTAEGGKASDFGFRARTLIDGAVNMHNKFMESMRTAPRDVKWGVKSALDTLDALRELNVIRGYTVVNGVLSVEENPEATLDTAMASLSSAEQDLFKYMAAKYGDADHLAKMKVVSESLYGIPFNARPNYAPQIPVRFDGVTEQSDPGKVIESLGNGDPTGNKYKRVGVKPSDRFQERGNLADPTQFAYSTDAVSNFISSFYESNFSIEAGRQMKALSYTLNSEDFREFINGVHNKHFNQGKFDPVYHGMPVRFDKIKMGQQTGQYNALLPRMADMMRDAAYPPYLRKDSRGFFTQLWDYIVSDVTATILNTSDQAIKQVMPNLVAGMNYSGVKNTLMAVRVFFDAMHDKGSRAALREFMKNFEADMRSSRGEEIFDEVERLMQQQEKWYRVATKWTEIKDKYSPVAIGKAIFKGGDRTAYMINALAAYIDAEIKAGRLSDAAAFDINTVATNPDSVYIALNAAEALNNASKAAERAPWTRNRTAQPGDTALNSLMRNMMFLKGFSLNAAMHAWQNAQIGFNPIRNSYVRQLSTQEERAQARMRTMAYVWQNGIFNALKVAILTPLYTMAGKPLVEAIFDVELRDETDEEKRKRRQKMAAQVLAQTFADGAVGWAPTPIENLSKGFMNTLYDLAADAVVGERERELRVNRDTPLDSRYKPFFENDGTGVGTLDLIGDLGTTFKDAFTTRSGNKYTAEGYELLDQMDVAKAFTFLLGQGDFLKLEYGMEKAIKEGTKRGVRPADKKKSDGIPSLKLNMQKLHIPKLK